MSGKFFVCLNDGSKREASSADEAVRMHEVLRIGNPQKQAVALEGDESALKKALDKRVAPSLPASAPF